MPNNPLDEERLDSDPTDELPILLETAVLDPEDRRVVAAISAPGDDDTAQHRVRLHAFAAAADEDEAESRDALRARLEQREAEIATLENDLRRLSARDTDLERSLVDRDAAVGERDAAIAALRASLAEQSAVEERLTTEIADRDGQFNELLDEIERLRRNAATAEAELAAARTAADAARAQIAALEAAAAPQPAPPGLSDELARLREEHAALAHSIDNRRALWTEVEARAAAAERRASELESELAQRVARQHDAESLSRAESSRASRLRGQLVEHGRKIDDLERELRALRAHSPATDLAAELRRQLAAAQAEATALPDLRAQLAAAQAEAAALPDLRAQLAAAQAEAAALPGLRAQLAAAQAEAGRFAALSAELAAAQADAARLENELTAAAVKLEAERAARAAETAAREAALAAATRAPLPPVEQPPLALAPEVLAQLEAELEHHRHQLGGHRDALNEQGERLAAAAAEAEQLRRQLAEARAQLEEKRSDEARLERALIDKDRALEARDERIATLQRELDERLGALQRLTAMEPAIKGLATRGAERLKRPETLEGTPSLVCLTSEQPRRYAIDKKTMTIGRSAQCDIQILTHFVSREHARLTLGREGVVIEDLGSTNGVFVNSVRVDRHELRHSDLVTVGETQFRFLETMAH
jgi:chromosome segregation ATPase